LFKSDIDKNIQSYICYSSINYFVVKSFLSLLVSIIVKDSGCYIVIVVKVSLIWEDSKSTKCVGVCVV